MSCFHDFQIKFLPNTDEVMTTIPKKLGHCAKHTTEYNNLPNVFDISLVEISTKTLLFFFLPHQLNRFL